MAPIGLTYDNITPRRVIENCLRSEYTSKITIETLLSLLLYTKRLQNLVGRGLNLLRIECIVW